MLSYILIELGHHLLDLGCQMDNYQLMALLMLIVLDDLFNPEIFSSSLGTKYVRRESSRALYTTHLKGMAWEMIDWLSTHMEWTVGGVRFNFGLEFEKEVGKQLGYIKGLRRAFIDENLTNDIKAEEKERMAATWDRELTMLSNLRPAIRSAFEKAEDEDDEDDDEEDPEVTRLKRINRACKRYPHLCPLVERLSSIVQWKAQPLGKKYTPLDPWERIHLGACPRDLVELKVLARDPIPDILDAYSWE